MKRRLFVAVALDEEARSACAAVAERLRAKHWAARWVPPENYHLTVAFLGSVDADRVDGVIEAVYTVAPSLAAFDVPLDAVGAFPNERRPRVAWVGPARTVPPFGTLCGVVRSALAACGFAFDARADAHVTLARSDGREPLPTTRPPDRANVGVRELTVYESVTAPSGARYIALERVSLQPA